MKFFAVIAAASVATVAAFAPKGSAVRSTELYNYAPTKWSPRSGANTSSYGAPSTRAAPAAPAAPAANGQTAPKNYSVTKWSPRGGPVPFGSDAAPAASPSAPVAAPAPAPAAPAGPTMADLAAQWAAMNKSD